MSTAKAQRELPNRLDTPSPDVRGKPTVGSTISPKGRSRRLKKNKQGDSNFAPRNTILQYLDYHQLDVPVVILSLLYLADRLGFAFAKPFLTLSYPVGEGKYTRGEDDVFLAFSFLLLITAARAATMRFILTPLARFCGVRRKVKMDRFAEQAWIVIWATFSLTYGLFLMKDAPYQNDSSQFWKGYPHRDLQPSFKLYYVMQAAFWSAQIVVLNIEKPRKDYTEMLIHHLVTISLISLSYTMNLTRVGHMILCITDLSDIFLSFAKCMRYSGCTTSCDVVFGIFVLSWIYSRFYLLGCVIYSVVFEARTYLKIGWSPATGHYLTENNIWIFVVLLNCLMALMIFWFALIIKVIIRVLGGVGAEDNRSDDEDEGDDADTNEATQNGKED